MSTEQNTKISRENGFPVFSGKIYRADCLVWPWVLLPTIVCLTPGNTRISWCCQDSCGQKPHRQKTSAKKMTWGNAPASLPFLLAYAHTSSDAGWHSATPKASVGIAIPTHSSWITSPTIVGSFHRPTHVDELTHQQTSLVVSKQDNAKATCPHLHTIAFAHFCAALRLRDGYVDM